MVPFNPVSNEQNKKQSFAAAAEILDSEKIGLVPSTETRAPKKQNESAKKRQCLINIGVILRNRSKPRTSIQ